jgi:uncharacterized protein with HEPN domain
MPKDDLLYIDHIRECVQKIEDFTNRMTFNDFLNNIAIQDAVIRNFEVIGEATKKLSKKFFKEHPEFPWTEMAGIRDKLIHDYFDFVLDVIWKTIKKRPFCIERFDFKVIT